MFQRSVGKITSSHSVSHHIAINSFNYYNNLENIPMVLRSYSSCLYCGFSRELWYHAVALFLFALDHHYVAAFEEQCFAPIDRLNLSIILVNNPTLQIFFLGLLSEFGV